MDPIIDIATFNEDFVFLFLSSQSSVNFPTMHFTVSAPCANNSVCGYQSTCAASQCICDVGTSSQSVPQDGRNCFDRGWLYLNFSSCVMFKWILLKFLFLALLLSVSFFNWCAVVLDSPIDSYSLYSLPARCSAALVQLCLEQRRADMCPSASHCCSMFHFTVHGGCVSFIFSRWMYWFGNRLSIVS